MAHKTESEVNHDALKFAENREKKVAPSLSRKITAGLGALVMSVGAWVGANKAPDNSDTGTKAGQAVGETVANVTKDAALDVEAEINAVVQDMHEDYKNSQAFGNNDGQKAVETEQEAQTSSIAAVKGPNGEIQYVDPATGEQVPPPESAQEQPFITGNDGHQAASIEQKANNP